MSDELDQPLSRRGAKSSSKAVFARARRAPLTGISLGLIGLVAVGIALWVALVNDPDGGRPVASAGIPETRDANPLASELSVPAAAPEQAIAEEAPEDASPGDAGPIEIAGLPIGDDIFDPLPDLIEPSQHGGLPQLGPSGQKPADIYARASVGDAGAAGRTRIGIIVTGLGLNRAATMEAITTLPDTVTLAFAPYGETVADSARAAREGGHEIMLQVPMEPFDYPDNDPGPQTLLTGQPLRANLDRLHWLMSRIGAYTGLVNHQGARFTASAVDFAPVMEEIGLRGLSYVDDGTSNRSLAPQLAGQNSVDFARADLIVDAEPSRSAILEQLGRLEQIASQRGTALGFASALPVSVRTIAEWAQEAEERGVLVVPVSALTAGPGA